MNNINSIEIKLDTTYEVLAGYLHGVEVFKSQVEPKINWNDENWIIFPSYLEHISSSFVRGFCSEVFKKVGVRSVYSVLKFKCDNPAIEKQLKNAIEFL